MAILEIKNISKSYGDFKAVQDISFNVEEGRMYGILGPNGAGKTTTIRMIMNILMPDKGKITLFGQQMNEKLKNRIGYLPEERGLYVKMKVIDMLVFLGRLHALSQKESLDRAVTWLEKLELLEWKENKIEELSKDMQQKIQFIGTIMHDPDLIILDEPFSGLDPINTQLIKDIMMELREQKKAIMFSTHIMDAAEKLCDDILLINNGRKVIDGELAEIKKRFGKNAIQIEYDGDGDFLKSQPQIEKYNDYGNYVEVLLKKDTKSNDLLKAIVERLTIRRYECTASSLNEIFIETIRREKNV
ncbi:MAG: ATP-binding cassette domain-containing protein [Candidatus Heimdallarchaeota archaeon]|nr:ATP-binding cassette domain-containing protein [Candidatus Heimdallarchaeota archaeon]